MQMMPVVSTTARLPTETAIDLSFPGGHRVPVRVPRERTPPPRERIVDDSETRPARLLGLGRGSLLVVVAALVLAAAVLVLLTVR
jgi:hypothetical protein